MYLIFSIQAICSHKSQICVPFSRVAKKQHPLFNRLSICYYCTYEDVLGMKMQVKSYTFRNIWLDIYVWSLLYMTTQKCEAVFSAGDPTQISANQKRRAGLQYISLWPLGIICTLPYSYGTVIMWQKFQCSISDSSWVRANQSPSYLFSIPPNWG